MGLNVMGTSTQLAVSPLRRVVRWVLPVLLVASAVLFIQRGPLRAIQSSSDFALLYAATHTWLVGGNPYSEVEQREAVREANPAGGLPDRQLLSLYPPPTFVLLAPFSIGSWPEAKFSWLSLNLAAFLALIGLCWRLGHLWPTEAAAWWMVVGLLALAPLHTSFFVGQLSLICTVGVLLAIVSLRMGRDLLAGLLLGVAMALKPQMAGLFLLYPMARLRWRCVVMACAAAAVVAVAAVVPMEIREIPWLATLRENLELFGRGEGGAGALNIFRHQLINLQYPLSSLLAHEAVVHAVTWVIGGGLVVMAYRVGRRTHSIDGELIALSLLAVASLLVVYHRFYDAVLLVLPGILLIRQWSEGVRAKVYWVMAGALAVFLVPGAVMLQQLAERGWIPAALAESFFWRMVILPHQVWALCVLGVCLVISWLRASPAESAASTNPARVPPP